MKEVSEKYYLTKFPSKFKKKVSLSNLKGKLTWMCSPLTLKCSSKRLVLSSSKSGDSTFLLISPLFKLISNPMNPMVTNRSHKIKYFLLNLHPPLSNFLSLKLEERLPFMPRFLQFQDIFFKAHLHIFRKGLKKLEPNSFKADKFIKKSIRIKISPPNGWDLKSTQFFSRPISKLQ